MVRVSPGPQNINTALRFRNQAPRRQILQTNQRALPRNTFKTSNPFLSINPATAPQRQPNRPTANRMQQNSDDTCRGPDLIYGRCTPIVKCQPLIGTLIQNPTNEGFANYLRISNEICGYEYSVVCCPFQEQNQQTPQPVFPKNTNKVPKKLLTMAEGCGYVDNAFRKIVGGKTSKIGAWPWIALIGYNDGVSASAFKCGGSLITSRHIVTAAHCLRPDLTFVRLGEHDLSTDTETKHIDVPVAKSLQHPQYNRKDGRNDIALLFLAQNVQFTERITPICLPITPQLRKKTFVNHTPFVAGWGRTMEGGKSATVLQELQIPVYDNSVCKDLYKKQNKLVSPQQFNNAVLCAGDLGGGKDTCQGDSGGPLMTPESFDGGIRFHLIGIVSYGIGCARPEIPGVYTRVTTFINWIKQEVARTT